MNNWYQNELIEHYKHPRHRGVLEHPDFATESHNPSCGDSVSFHGEVRDGTLVRVAFQGVGCVISQGMASMLAHKVTGMTLEQVQQIGVDDVIALLKMELGPTRLKCALLPLEALQAGIAQYLIKGAA